MPDKLTVVADLLKVVIGEDPNRGGLIETPIRVAKAWQHWAGGYKEDPAEILKTFEDGAEDYNQIILVKDIPIYSHCEHHLAPFFGVAHVAYIPDGKIVGLSKLSRVVDVFARRLQVQERLTSQVANAIQDALQPKAVGVIIECRHMCMESRGIQRQGASTVTSAMKGLFEWDRSAKEELLDLVRR
jgi:GTP cyclohydrolase I|tara:strand:+ start:2277 stop:2834 length:558 start_codon:yes stop_codon:yes gene_type:complete